MDNHNQEHRDRVLAEILANDKHLDCHSQRRRMIKAFEQLGTVNTFEFSRKLDVYDPRARKCELVKKGYEIVCVKLPTLTESGEYHMIGHYTLVGFKAKEAV